MSSQVLILSFIKQSISVACFNTLHYACLSAVFQPFKMYACSSLGTLISWWLCCVWDSSLCAAFSSKMMEYTATT